MRPLLILFNVLCVLYASAQDWQLKKDEGGIKVYTRPNSQSAFDSFKAEMAVKTTVAQVVAILKNIEKYPEIFPDILELRVLSRPNDSTQIQYSLSDAPWPVWDRDGIYEMVFIHDRPKKGVNVRSRALPNFLPEKEGVVRIIKSQSSWKIHPIGEGLVRIVYEVSAEPGGNIPDWLANSAAIEVPYETFVNLRGILTD